MALGIRLSWLFFNDRGYVDMLPWRFAPLMFRNTYQRWFLKRMLYRSGSHLRYAKPTGCMVFEKEKKKKPLRGDIATPLTLRSMGHDMTALFLYDPLSASLLS